MKLAAGQDKKRKVYKFCDQAHLLGAEQSAQYELPSIFLILSEAFRTNTFFALAAELDRSASDLASDLNINRIT